MRRWMMQSWMPVAGLLLIAVSAFPVLRGFVATLIPLPLWVLLLVLFCALTHLSVSVNQVITGRFAYAAAVTLCWTLVLSAPGAVFSGFSAALIWLAGHGVGLMRLRWLLVIIAANTAISDLSSASSAEVSTTGRLTMAMLLILVQLTIVTLIASLAREQRLREELAQAYVGLESAEAVLRETTRAAERVRISRELHDLLGHRLTVLNLHLEAARHRQQNQHSEALSTAQQMTRDIIGDLRSTVSDLRSSTVRPLVETIENIGETLSGIELHVQASGDFELDEQQHISLLRTVQELVTNTVRHSDAQEISLLVEADSQALMLSYSDDGAGAEPIVPGHGLRGLTERFQSLGGGVDYAAEGGFRFRAWMPKR